MKLWNFFRTLDRMKKYNYMTESNFYKTASEYRRQYASSKTRAEKAIVRDLIESHIKQNPSLSKVPAFKKRVKTIIETVNRRYGEGQEILTYENINDYVDYIAKVSDYYGNYFYDIEKSIDIFNDVVVISGESVETALKRLLPKRG